MYLYLYDAQLNDKRWASTLAQIETRLTDLGIAGKIYRLSPLRSLGELLADEIRSSGGTVVIVGNDRTLSHVVNVLGPYDVVVGLIPIGNENRLAKLLGVPSGVAACETLAARKIERIDLGKVNTTYFLAGLQIQGSKVTVECDDSFRLSPLEPNTRVSICNFPPGHLQAGKRQLCNPQDGLLEVVFEPFAEERSAWGLLRSNKPLKETIISFRKATIRSRESTPVITDGQKVLKTPVTIEVVAKKLRVIVGKDRAF